MTPDTLGFLDARRAGCPSSSPTAHEQAGMVLDRATLPDADAIDNIVVLGMGGSGHRRRRAPAPSRRRCPVPVIVLKQIRTPAFVGPAHPRVRAVVLGQHRGDARDGRRARSTPGARLVAVTARRRARRARRERRRAAHPVPAGLPCPAPRSARSSRRCSSRCSASGCSRRRTHSSSRRQAQLKRRRDQCAPNVEGAANPARELARRIGRTIPLIYGGGALGAVAAYRWKCDVNENAKAPAFDAAYPELDHNEICGWGQHGDVTRQLLTLVELRHGFEHDRLAAAVRPRPREIIEEAVHQVLAVKAEGEGRLAAAPRPHVPRRLGVSCYLALDNDVDPGPIDAITQLKAAHGPRRPTSLAAGRAARSCHPVIRADSPNTAAARPRARPGGVA